MKTETLAEKLESIDCRRDDKARRVSNCAPDTVANITPDELENGVTLERLDSLNVPALRYSTQITIHGKIPAFNSAARPGGYKAIFQNGNGSVGVRFVAIDGEKKETILRAARVAGKDCAWHAFRNSTGFYLQRSFYVRDEAERAAQRAATVAALKNFPVSLFYGSAGAYSLPYGLGYAVEVNLGAIPAASLWEFIAAVFGVVSPEDLAEREAKRAAESAAKHAEWQAERAAENEKAAAENRAKVAAFFPVTVPPENGRVFILSQSGAELLTVDLKKSKGRASYCIAERNGVSTYNTAKACKVFLWPKALVAGRVYSEESAPATPPAVSPVAAIPGTDENAAPSERQTFALFCATGRDFRKLIAAKGLTYGQISAAIAAAQPFRASKDKPAALAVVSALIGAPMV